MSHRPAIGQILQQVEGWSFEDRHALAIELLKPVTAPAQAARASLGDLVAIAGGGRTITDAELEELRYEALKEKYGL